MRANANATNGGLMRDDVEVVPTAREWIRLGEVMRLTGWGKQYVAKLRANAVLDVRQDYAKAQRWYRRSQVLGMVK